MAYMYEVQNYWFERLDVYVVCKIWTQQHFAFLALHDLVGRV